MKKKQIKISGHDYFLLGTDAEGTKYFMEDASWDCGWYLVYGYIVTFTNNHSPANSSDIQSVEHFDTKFSKCEDFLGFWKETPLSREEQWTLMELMRTYYVLRAMADCMYIKGTNCAVNPCEDVLDNHDIYRRINQEMLPAIFKQVKTLLGGTNENNLYAVISLRKYENSEEYCGIEKIYSSYDDAFIGANNALREYMEGECNASVDDAVYSEYNGIFTAENKNGGGSVSVCIQELTPEMFQQNKMEETDE